MIVFQVEFKTISLNAYLMHGAGTKDFHSILILNGHIQYQWDCGSGVGEAKIEQIRVDDGQWHNLKIVRRGSQVKIVLDNQHQIDGVGQSGCEVINLYSQATV
jgi:hypothetical protein